jgi:hypothetical protein
VKNVLAFCGRVLIITKKFFNIGYRLGKENIKKGSLKTFQNNSPLFIGEGKVR